VNTVKNLHFHKASGLSGLADELLTSQEGLRSTAGWLVNWFVNR